MQELRVVLTVLPVGPRGEASLAAGGRRWFAVQIAAGFAEPADPGELDGLWPWVLQVVENGRVDLRGWLTGPGGPQAPFDLTAEAPTPGAFGEGLRAAIREPYAAPEVRADLDLRWLLPSETAVEPDRLEHERRSFPARVQYLATLPGEMARRLLATVYVGIETDRLFTRDAAGRLQLNGETLWIAPRLIGRLPDRQVELTGAPAASAREPRVFELSAQDDTLPVTALGPGFALQRLLAADTFPFDLATYRMPVGDGDRRFAEVESLLLAALDPFGEIEHLPSPREAISFGNPGRPLTEEAAGALQDLWRVQALARELEVVIPAGVQRLARRLLALGDPLPPLTVPDRWRISSQTDLQEQVQSLATALGITGESPRERLRSLAARAGFATVAVWLAQTFDATLAGSPQGPVNALVERWSFGGGDAAGLAERRLALARVVVDELREEREAAPLLAGLAAAGADDSESGLRSGARARIEARWSATAGRLGPQVANALAALGLGGPDETLILAPGVTERLAEAHLATVWPAAREERPELPGRGLTLVLGPGAQRLVHEENRDLVGDFNGLYGEIAGVALLARRGRNGEDIARRPWRLVTGGAALRGALGNRLFVPGQINGDEWLRELLAVPLRPAFQQGVARADLEYHGQPMLAQSALDHAYAVEEFVEAAPAGPAAAYSFQALGGFRDELPAETAASRAPVLRYGDSYQFRAALVDQAGGLPPEIARDGEPWRLDPARLAVPTPLQDGDRVIPFRRRVPVGEINLLPSPDPGSGTRAWPALPPDISLRSREWWALENSSTESLPVLLLGTPASGFTGTRPEYAFEVLPPAIDEHTLLRWALPALEAPGADAAVQALKEALARLFEARQADAPARAHDPAVTAIGVRVRHARADNTLEPPVTQLIDLPPSGRPFESGAVQVRVVAVPFGAAPGVIPSGAALEIRVPEGGFASLEIWPLVPRADFETRFASREVFGDLLDGTDPWPGHVAFRPSVVLTEGATDRLPSREDLYAGLVLRELDGSVAVHFQGDPDRLAFVDRFTLERERWVWRNRPLATARSIAQAPNPEERRRLAASGPPLQAFNPDLRDEPAGPVADWESLAALDRGFIDRGELTDRWPRKAPADPARHTGGTLGGVLLALDDREAVTAADYLRYGLRVRSRYTGVLSEKQREEEAVSPRGQKRRRITIGFRGARIKPPKILAVLPLTRPLQPDPLAARTSASPFLVLLDEIFFREYGIGERLEARLSRESLDTGEDPATVLPYRTGPLPDHWLRPAARFVPDAERLDLFGPFGYSLDVSPAEALANASAFVIYPPPGVGPHWALFARFHRILDQPSADQESEPSDSYALYTLPDSGLLARAEGDEPALDRIVGPAAPSVFTPRNLRLVLDPLALPSGNGAPARNSEAASQYRYFLLVSRVLRGAGQALEVELPVGLWRLPLFDPRDGFQPQNRFDVELGPGTPVTGLMMGGSQPLEAGGAYRGRVLEVLLNGRYEGESRLDGDLHWHDFWRGLLADEPTGETDAAGMIRRISDSFVVRA